MEIKNKIIGKVYIPITDNYIESIKNNSDSKWKFDVKNDIGDTLGQVIPVYVEVGLTNNQYEQFEELIKERSFEDYL